MTPRGNKKVEATIFIPVSAVITPAAPRIIEVTDKRFVTKHRDI
jgi:hypothetical protein